MKLLILITAFLASTAFAGTCSTTSRNNYSVNQILTSSALNADFNQLVTKANAFDGGCVTDGTLESGSLNTTDFSVVLNGIQQGCLVSYSDSNTLSIAKCMASVNGAFVKTSVATTVTWGCSGCSSEVSATLYYLYVKTGSSGTTLTPLISTVAPNADGYDNSGNRALAKFYNNASSDIDANYIYMWDKFAFQDETNPLPAGTVFATSASTCSPGFLAADGSAVSRTTYARLFATIGETHGEGNNTTTFNVPDYRGRFLRGVDGAAGRDPDDSTRTAMGTNGNAGDNVGSVQGEALKAHTHSLDIGNNLVDGSSGTRISAGVSFGINNTTTTSASSGSETRPINAYVTYCVKY